ncbi:MAG: DUF1844 domain-containing protein [Chthoniobacterales bacterium]|nr:DUF1844 domain-containing protein [Chthoniobacterales bacterium]
MPEVQSSTQSDGQVTQRFIEFVMVQAQQAAFCLGKIPHPATGETAVNLEAARVFIDHLELIREKTRGNLSKEEDTILNKVLAELQMTFVQVSGDSTESAEISDSPEVPVEADSEGKGTDHEGDSKKKFSKSYGG